MDFERYVLDAFSNANAVTIPTAMLFDNSPSNADVVRAITALEDRGVVIRYTYGGTDWVSLTGSNVGGAVEVPQAAPAQPPQIVYTHPHEVRSRDGSVYRVYVLGAQRADGTWSGWIEFVSPAGTRRVRTSQETSQPNRDALAYWASGLEDVYYEGALSRARE